jgi:hypothetical protein
MKVRKIIFLLLLASLVVGCATPKAVKQLSTEIVDVNVKYHQSLTTYFSVIEKFVDAQIEVAEFLIKEADEGIVKDYKKLATEELNKPNPNVNAILAEFEEGVSENANESQSYLAKLDGLNAQLKSKHKELLEIQSNIIDAQIKLNKYVQLEKADEALVNELLGVVGVQMSEITNTVDDISNIYNEINTISGSIIK